MLGNSRLQIRNDIPVTITQNGQLRFGLDREILTLSLPHPTLATIVSLLRTGVHTETLAELAARSGLTRKRLQAMLDAMSTVITCDDSASNDQQLSVAAFYDPLSVNTALQRELAHSGILARKHSTSPLRVPPTTLRTVISVERFFHDSHAQETWLASGYDVLPVKFSDRSITIGPLINEQGACGRCCNMQLAANDAQWASSATQLTGRHAPTETPANSSLAAGLIGTMLRLISSPHASKAQQLQYAVRFPWSGAPTVTTETVFMHRACPNHARALDAA